MQITIPGEPQGKARAKVVYRQNMGRSVAITPDKTVMYENLIRVSYLGKDYFDDVPISMRIHAYYGIPKSASKKKAGEMLSGHLRPTKKPDSDNIAKVVADALNQIAYKDDSQIVDLFIKKLYSENPRVEVEIEG